VNDEFLLPERDLGDSVVVVDNDTTTVAAIGQRRPAAVVISPGPRTPAEAGISVELIRSLGAGIPILGVCLGHQAIGEAYGGRVVRAPSLMHGKISQVHHVGTGLFAGVPDPFPATRYHSLVVEPASLPATLEVTARTDEGVIMALRHREHPVVGVQFHPESIGTDAGYRILENFLEMTAAPLGARA
jgi:anthranilate synthase component 2